MARERWCFSSPSPSLTQRIEKHMDGDGDGDKGVEGKFFHGRF